MGTKNLNSATDLITFTRASGGTALRKISYGSELVTNGDFDGNIDGWTGGSYDAVTGDLSLISSGFVDAYQIGFDPTKKYLLTYTVSEYTSGNISAYDGTVFGSYTNAVGTYSIIISPDVQRLGVRVQNGPVDAKISNISVKEVLYDQPDGTLQLFNHPDNVPRIEYDADGTVKGLLIEEARTNLMPYSNQANQLSYYSDGITTGVDTTEVSSPQNSGTVIKLNKTATGFGFARVTYSLVTYAQTISFFVKKGTARYIGIRQLASSGTHTTFDLETNTWVQNSGSSSRGYEDYGNGWLRLWVVSDDNISKLWASIAITNSQGDESNYETGTVYIFGLQREQGTFPTSYIPTTGATATRAADIVSIPVADFGYNDDAGSLVIDYDTPNIQVSDRLLSLSTGFVNRVFDISLSGTDFINYSDASGQINLGSLTSTGKVAVAFESAKEFVGVKDGAVITVDPTTTAVTRPETLYIGTWFTTSDRFPNGHIKSIKYYPRRLSNAQLQELTT